MFFGGSRLSRPETYVYQQILLRREFFLLWCPTKHSAAYSVVISQNFCSSARLRAKRELLDEGIHSVCCPGAFAARRIDTIQYMPFSLANNVWSLTLMIKRGPIAFGISLFELHESHFVYVSDWRGRQRRFFDAIRLPWCKRESPSDIIVMISLVSTLGRC